MPVIDHVTAQNVLGGLPISIVSVVLNGFELDVRRLTKNMLRAALAGDAVAYSHAAHALADTASHLGATELALMARGALQHPICVLDLSLVQAGENAIGEMKIACAC
jgi:UDP-N-acetylmuramyl pentapeptide synthase